MNLLVICQRWVWTYYHAKYLKLLGEREYIWLLSSSVPPPTRPPDGPLSMVLCQARPKRGTKIGTKSYTQRVSRRRSRLHPTYSSYALSSRNVLDPKKNILSLFSRSIPFYSRNRVIILRISACLANLVFLVTLQPVLRDCQCPGKCRSREGTT